LRLVQDRVRRAEVSLAQENARRAEEQLENIQQGNAEELRLAENRARQAENNTRIVQENAREELERMQQQADRAEEARQPDREAPRHTETVIHRHEEDIPDQPDREPFEFSHRVKSPPNAVNTHQRDQEKYRESRGFLDLLQQSPVVFEQIVPTMNLDNCLSRHKWNKRLGMGIKTFTTALKHGLENGEHFPDVDTNGFARTIWYGSPPLYCCKDYKFEEKKLYTWQTKLRTSWHTVILRTVSKRTNTSSYLCRIFWCWKVLK